MASDERRKGGEAPLRGRSRGRLFRKYVVIIVVLVSGALLTSGAVELYFSYQENKTALIAIQREKAIAAASRIEAFIKEIEHQIGWTTQPQLVAPSAALDQRRFDFLRLLRQVLAITEISYLDATGKEQLRVSRLAMDVVGSQIDFSRDPKFQVAKSGRTYYGDVTFRKESEPYMTIAMAGSGQGAGVTAVEVNLKFIWDVVSQIKVGKAGQAYAVDGKGNLLAHPDISLVLQKTAFSSLPQVQAAITGAPRPGSAGDELAIARDFKNRRVLTAFATIPSLRWSVFVEQPLEEAFEPLRASMQRTALLLLLGVVLSFLASLVLARRMVRPIGALQAGAAKIGAGDLSERIEVRTGDELEALADQFNSMAGQLKESYAGLERKVDERTRELTEALEQQTATSEILRVISSSPTNVQPVFDAIVRNAVRLCDGRYGGVFRFDGTLVHFVAQYNLTPEAAALHAAAFPARPDRAGLVGRAIRQRAVVQVADVESDPQVNETTRKIARAIGYRSAVSVPMLKEGQCIGTINVARVEAGLFSEASIELLKTFADQAVIAVENVRLFTELQERTRELSESVQELRTLSEVAQAVSATLDVDRVLETIAVRANALARTDGCSIYEYDAATETFHLRVSQNLELVHGQTTTVLRKGEGVVGRLAVTRAPAQVPDIADASVYQSSLRDSLLAAGFRALLAVPLMSEGLVTGGLVVSRKTPGEFPSRVIDLLTTFATQSALAIQNARLFREIEDKGRQLEVANRHKSEFLASMSHELRTPLNAVIGFSEVLLERMFGEINDKQEEYLRDIYSSGKHLLSLINDILDLSKVEAGRMELELTTFSLPMAIENALTLVRTRAENHDITLEVHIDERLGDFVGDERKFKQILLNLLSNAVKFTSEGGRVAVDATLANGSVEIAVSDSGIGIAEEDQARIFEEFQQAGPDHAGKREGTGLGLTLTRKFVELHGGSIWVKSQIGHGATFTFALPVRPWPTSSS
jgi:signal transduction histidine kinase/HAMP domain-containing protein